MLSLLINRTKSNSTDDVISKHQSSFNIIQRIIFILSIVSYNTTNKKTKSF